MKVNRRFGGTCHLNLQGQRIDQERNHREADSKQTSKLVYCLGLFFGPEDRGDMFLRKVGCLSTDYTVLYPRRQNSS
jgi:hypothetical protein